MVLTGGLNLLLRRSHGAWRLLATGAVGGSLLGLVWAWVGSAALVRSVGLVMGGSLLACVLFGSARVGRLGARLAGLVRRPEARWGTLLAIGLVSVVGSAAVYQAEETAAIDH